MLDRVTSGQWLPLRAGRTYSWKVREIREGGNSRLEARTAVLSVAPGMVKKLPHIQPGANVIISTTTLPAMRGVRTAISGGPVLLRAGRRLRLEGGDSESYQASSMFERHPRSAVGWNGDYFFLVAVDGRHRRHSVGMTLGELASFLLELGCQEAINLDGGGSSTLWYNGQVRNRPCDGYERSVANALVVVEAKTRLSNGGASGGIGGASAAQTP